MYGESTKESFANPGTLDMLHSLYDFKATYAKTLSFRTNEYFILHQTNTKHKNWWEVINEAGEMGFIPSNYVETVTVNPSFYLQFLDTCLDNLKARPENMGDRQEVVGRLKDVKRQIEQLPELHRIGADGDDAKPLPYKNSDGHFQSVKSSSSSHSSLLTELKNDVMEEPIRPVQKASKERVRKSIENIHEEVSSEVYNDRKKSDARPRHHPPVRLRAGGERPDQHPTVARDVPRGGRHRGARPPRAPPRLGVPLPEHHPLPSTNLAGRRRRPDRPNPRRQPPQDHLHRADLVQGGLAAAQLDASRGRRRHQGVPPGAHLDPGSSPLAAPLHSDLSVSVERGREHLQTRHLLRSVPLHRDLDTVLPDGDQVVHQAVAPADFWGPLQPGQDSCQHHVELDPAGGACQVKICLPDAMT
jgi:hypothetical protein